MADWNPKRNPNDYPAHWHGIIVARPGRYIVATTKDVKEARKLMNRFNAFKACLRHHPMHPATPALAARNFRLFTEVAGESVAVCVTVMWSGELVRSIEQQLHGIR